MKHYWISLGLLLVLVLYSCSIGAQCPSPTASNCQGIPNSALILSTSGNVDFTFNTTNQYEAGVTQNGATLLRLLVLPNNSNCQWTLRMYVNNNPGAGTPGNQWEKIQGTSTKGVVPTIDLLQVRVSNACGTPIFNGVYQEFTPSNGSYIDIISSSGATPINPTSPPACNGTHVNGAGSYLTDYGEYSFTIDYRIVPNMNHMPGTFQLEITFCLVEV